MGNYPEGDTWQERNVPSGIAFPDMNPGAPDKRGFGPTGDAAFAASSGATVQADGSVTTDFSEPGGGFGGGHADVSADGGTP